MRTVASLVLATFMISLTSGASSAQTAKEWEDVIAAAKREGQIVVYTAYISKNTHDPIAKAFEKNTGSRSAISLHAEAKSASACVLNRLQVAS